MSIHKRIPALLLGVILLFAGIPAGSISAQAADTTQQLNNIVLFAQFPDADTDNFMADKTDTAIAICNDTSTPRSLTSYIDAISYGKLHVNSYFPQLSDGVIQPYILQNSKAEYTSMNSTPLKWCRISGFLTAYRWTAIRTAWQTTSRW